MVLNQAAALGGRVAALRVASAALCRFPQRRLGAGQLRRTSSAPPGFAEKHPDWEYVPWNKGERFTPSDFSAPVWRHTLMVITVAFALYQYNVYYTRNLPEGKFHPITEFLASLIYGYEEEMEDLEKKFKQVEIDAADHLILLEMPKERPRVWPIEPQYGDLERVTANSHPATPEMDPDTVVPVRRD